MKIINSEKFLNLPSGTMYQIYKSNICTGQLCVKGETHEDGSFKYKTVSGSFVVPDFMGCGSDSKPIDLDNDCPHVSWYDPNEMFLIYELDDIKKIMSLMGLVVIEVANKFFHVTAKDL